MICTDLQAGKKASGKLSLGVDQQILSLWLPKCSPIVFYSLKNMHPSILGHELVHLSPNKPVLSLTITARFIFIASNGQTERARQGGGRTDRKGTGRCHSCTVTVLASNSRTADGVKIITRAH